MWRAQFAASTPAFRVVSGEARDQGGVQMQVKSAAVVRTAMANRDLRRVLVAYLIFNIGEWATWITLLVWAYERGGVRGSGAVALVQLVPSALLATPVASLCQRFTRGQALKVGYAAQSLTSLALGMALITNAPVGVVGALGALAAVTITATRPVHNALLPEISLTTGDLTVGNAATGSVEAMAAFIGPMFSGVVIAAWTIGGVPLIMGVLLMTASLLTGGVTTAATPPPASTPARSVSRGPAGMLRPVLADPAARLLSGLVAAEYVLVGMMDILLVVLAVDTLSMSASGPAILNSALGLGGLAGAAFTFVLIGRRRLAPALAVGAVGAGFCFAISALSGTVVAAFVLIAATGAGKLFFDVCSRTLVQRLLPDRLLTAVFGLQEAMMMAGLALGTLIAPVLVQWLGAQVSFVAAGLFLPFVTLVAYPWLRTLDAGADVPADVLAGLLGVPILAVLAPRVVERLARDADVVTAESGEVVIAEGEPGQLFFVVSSGRLDVTIDGQHIRQLGAGGWFGELALLRDVPRTATVTAAERTVLWAVERDSFLAAVAAAPQAVKAADDHADDTYQ